MILPIVAYGSPVLKKVSNEITPEYPNLKELIENMWETMYAAHGIGLAAPQVGQSIRLFVIDASPFVDEENMDVEEINTLKDFKKVFINPKIVVEEGAHWNFNEGCLSIPDVREDISRNSEIKIKYQDQNFNWHTDSFDGITARVIQHEYDHIEGILFTDRISPLRKRMIKGKLQKIYKGNIDVNYRMRFFKK